MDFKSYSKNELFFYETLAMSGYSTINILKTVFSESFLNSLDTITVLLSYFKTYSQLATD